MNKNKNLVAVGTQYRFYTATIMQYSTKRAYKKLLARKVK